MTPKLRAYLAIGLTFILGVMLLFAIYFTLLDLQWIAFLAGVLFAAVLAVASQLSRAQWLIARRTKQWLRTKKELAEEVSRRERAAEAQKAAEKRLQFVNDALPVMMLFVDRLEYCRYHNRAFALWFGRHDSQIDGLLLRDVLGGEIYADVKSRVAEVLSGAEARFDAAWKNTQGSIITAGVALLPYPPETERPAGFYALMTPYADATPPSALIERGGDQLIMSGESDELIYLNSLTGQLLGSKDPRAQLVSALQEDRFILFAQKIQPLGAGVPHPRCFEILLRLREEEENMAPPGGFIPVAEHYGLMMDIDRWVVRNTMKWALSRQRGDPAWKMPLFCVNLSAASLAAPEFALNVKDELARQKFPAAQIGFEIAEPDVIGQHSAVQAFMGTLHPLGCRFTLDAFGGAKVSFAPLKGLPFDFLKIDGVIIRGLLTDRADLARTRAITLTAHKMGLRTIASFVESDGTLEKLREIGTDYVQGFGISKPGPIAQVA